MALTRILNNRYYRAQLLVLIGFYSEHVHTKQVSVSDKEMTQRETLRRSGRTEVGVCGNSLQTKQSEQRQAGVQNLQGCVSSTAIQALSKLKQIFNLLVVARESSLHIHRGSFSYVWFRKYLLEIEFPKTIITHATHHCLVCSFQCHGFKYTFPTVS